VYCAQCQRENLAESDSQKSGVGDMMETYKILNKLYDERVAPGLVQSPVITTRSTLWF